jgi:hypothetical protein
MPKITDIVKTQWRDVYPRIDPRGDGSVKYASKDKSLLITGGSKGIGRVSLYLKFTFYCVLIEVSRVNPIDHLSEHWAVACSYSSESYYITGAQCRTP